MCQNYKRLVINFILKGLGKFSWEWIDWGTGEMVRLVKAFYVDSKPENQDIQ